MYEYRIGRHCPVTTKLKNSACHRECWKRMIVKLFLKFQRRQSKMRNIGQALNRDPTPFSYQSKCQREYASKVYGTTCKDTE